jgi:hypothetical protein
MKTKDEQIEQRGGVIRKVIKQRTVKKMVRRGSEQREGIGVRRRGQEQQGAIFKIAFWARTERKREAGRRLSRVLVAWNGVTVK